MTAKEDLMDSKKIFKGIEQADLKTLLEGLGLMTDPKEETFVLIPKADPLSCTNEKGETPLSVLFRCWRNKDFMKMLALLIHKFSNLDFNGPSSCGASIIEAIEIWHAARLVLGKRYELSRLPSTITLLKK